MLECDDPEPRAQSPDHCSSSSTWSFSPVFWMLLVPHFPLQPRPPGCRPGLPTVHLQPLRLHVWLRSSAVHGPAPDTRVGLILDNVNFIFPSGSAKNLESSLTPFPHPPLLIWKNAVSNPLKAYAEPNTSGLPPLQQPRWAKQLTVPSHGPGVNTSPSR